MFRATVIALAILTSDIVWGYNLGLKDGSFLSVDESYIEWREYESYRNPYMPDKYDWQWTGEFHNTVSIWKLLYWKTNVHMSMDETQIRYGGLEYYLGFKIMSYLHIVKFHHSQHCFDKQCVGKFPVEDGFGARVYFKQ